MDLILIERLEFLAIAVFAVLILSVLAWNLGYYRYPVQYFKGPFFVELGDVIGVFALFLGVELVVVPGLVFLGYSLYAGHFIDLSKIKIDNIMQGWLNLLAVIASFVAILFFLFLQTPQKRNLIVWGGSTDTSAYRALRDLGLGILTWFLSYPLVMAISQLTELGAYFFWPQTEIDQVAVKHLKMTMESPLLFICTAVAIVFIVPVAEEILFRGFLQRWMVKNIGRSWGIALTAAFFACFHFSTSQQWENIELLISLFILACFLGFLYERQGSLWAPLGLHITFNAISVSMITFGEFF